MIRSRASQIRAFHSRERAVSYEAWERTVPPAITGDPLWKLRVYRAALYAGELGHRDAEYLVAEAGLRRDRAGAGARDRGDQRAHREGVQLRGAGAAAVL